MTSFFTQKSKGLLKNQDSLPLILSSFLHKKQMQKMKIELAESTLDFEFKSHGFNACNKVPFIMHKCHYIKGVRFHLFKTIAEARKKYNSCKIMHSWAWVNLTHLGSNATTTSYGESLNHNLFKILRKYF